MPKKKILFIGGSLNMTRMVHEVSRHLCDEYDCYFTPFYSDGIYNFLATRTHLIDFTVLGTGNFRRQTMAYFEEHNLPVDLRGESQDYDLVVITSDLYIPKNIRNKPFVLIQEGMTRSGKPDVLSGKISEASALPGEYIHKRAIRAISLLLCSV
ncbi:MAG: hypothetical protein R3C44_06860 [Chloroflexota bacterium]